VLARHRFQAQVPLLGGGCLKLIQERLPGEVALPPQVLAQIRIGPLGALVGRPHRQHAVPQRDQPVQLLYRVRGHDRQCTPRTATPAS
jgi:hypothetical protein